MLDINQNAQRRAAPFRPVRLSRGGCAAFPGIIFHTVNKFLCSSLTASAATAGASAPAFSGGM